jgi:hypothetical protein
MYRKIFKFCIKLHKIKLIKKYKYKVKYIFNILLERVCIQTHAFCVRVQNVLRDTLLQ